MDGALCISAKPWRMRASALNGGRSGKSRLCSFSLKQPRIARVAAGAGPGELSCS